MARAAAERERVARLDRAVQVANGVAALSGALTQQRIDLESDPDYRTHAERFQAFAQDQAKQILANLPDDETRAEFSIRAAGLLEGNQLEVYQRAERLRVSDMQAQALPRRQAYLRAAAEGGPAVRRMNLDLYDEDVASDPGLDPLQKEKLRQAGRAELEKADFLRGSEAIATASSAGAAQAVASAMLARIDSSEHLSPEESERARLTVHEQLRLSLDRMDREARERQQDAADQAAADYLGRILGKDAEARPSIAEIQADPSLRFATKAELVGMLSRAERGEAVANRSALKTDLWFRIHDPASTNPIRSVSDLLPFASSLSSADVAELGSQIERVKTEGPDQKQARAEFAHTVKTFERAISQSSAFVTLSPDQAQKANTFVYEANRRWDDAIAAGKDPRAALLDPASPDYLGTLAKQPRFQTTMAEVAAQFGAQSEATQVPETEVKGGETRRADESTADALKRVYGNP
jgi:hypothetical protein